MASYQEQAEQMILKENANAVLLEGIESALLGYVNLWGGGSVAVYDSVMVVKILMKKNNISAEQALSYFQSQIDSKYMGPNTPLFLLRPVEDSILAEW